MRRIEASKDVADRIRDVLVKIERQEEHDENKVEQVLNRLSKHGGVDLSLGDHFEIKNYGGEVYVTSMAVSNDLAIGNAEPSLKGDMYIIGRESGSARELVYYKVSGSNISKRECGRKAHQTVSRFDLALIPSGDRVEIFNLGKNKTDLYFEGEIEF